MKTTQRLKDLSRPTGEEDLLRVEYPQPRVSVTPQQAGIAVGIAAVCLVAWFFIRGDALESQAHEVNGVSEPQWSVSETPTAPEQIVVAVVGAVANPGLVTLEPGARVADALDQARPLPEADLISVNLAQLLVDGQQIHVLAHGEAPPAGAVAQGPGGVGAGSAAGGGAAGSGAASGAAGGVSLNSASAQELTSLPGVGEATAAAIVAHRESKGPFTAIEQLMDVKGIGPAKFDAVKDLIVL